MKLFFIYSLITLISFSAFTQGAFYLKNNVKKNFEVLATSESNDGFLLVGSSSSGSSNSSGYLSFIDLFGKTLWEKFILDTTVNDSEQYTSTLFYDGSFYVGGIVSRDGKKYNLLLKINKTGEILYRKEIGVQSFLSFDNHLKEIIINGNGILIATSGFHDNRTQGELIQVDFDGNILWKNKFFSYVNADNSFWEYFDDIRKSNENNFILILSSNSNFINLSYKTIIKIDNLGNEIWRKTIDTIIPSSSTSDSLSLLSATSFNKGNTLALFNIESSLQEDFRRDFALVEYDQNGDEINYKRFYNANAFGSSKILTDKDDNIYISGTRHFSDSLRLSLIKLNRNKDVEWDYTYLKERANIVDSQWLNSGESFTNSNLTSDGGFMLFGDDLYMIDDNFYWNSSIVKTDCQGDTTWHYNYCYSPRIIDISIFPNPSNEQFIVQIPNLSEQDEIKIYVYGLQGKKIFEGKYTNNVITIDAKEWSNGAYLSKILINNKVDKTFKLIKTD